MPKSRKRRKNGKIVQGKAFIMQTVVGSRQVEVAESINKKGEVMREGFFYIKPIYKISRHSYIPKMIGIGLYGLKTVTKHDIV